MFENTAHIYNVIYEFSGQDYRAESELPAPGSCAGPRSSSSRGRLDVEAIDSPMPDRDRYVGFKPN